MNESYIQSRLMANLDNEYELTNSYIFRWESDYFGISKSGLAYEIEIKTSRSDFFADFNKVDKHKEFEAALCGKKYFTRRGSLHYSCQRLYDTGYRKKVLTWHTIKETFTKEYDVKEDEKNRNIQLLHSSVYFNEILVPNRFIYACPEGLIKKGEVPKYAGLFYIRENGNLDKIKMGPVIHKAPLNITGVLLKKFYQLSSEQKARIFWLKEENEKLRSVEGNIVEYAAHSPLDQIKLDFE